MELCEKHQKSINKITLGASANIGELRQSTTTASTEMPKNLAFNEQNNRFLSVLSRTRTLKDQVLRNLRNGTTTVNLSYSHLELNAATVYESLALALNRSSEKRNSLVKYQFIMD